MLARVSNIEAFRRWRQNEDQDVDDLVRWITASEPSAAMEAGTAFHKALELAREGDHETMEANGLTFVFSGGEIAIPEIREMRAFAAYGGLNVTGQVDCIEGKVVTDHKTTARFDGERYLSGCQWKFYLDIFGADEFRWNVFEIKETEPKVFRVSEPQVLRAYRYPEMSDHCHELAADYLEFARRHLPREHSALEAG